ncbi:MAG: nucleotidyltransferase domain-containing protein [Bacteroidales bacterium]|nr:nucleotidyltransferase domain-containing protein [Bacteroidales bacterium]
MDKGIIKSINNFISLIRKNHKGVERAFIFGSYARNLENKDSDIDIALVFESISDSEKFDLQVQLILLASQIDSRIEPHPISKADFNSNKPFIAEIQKTGIEINL